MASQQWQKELTSHLSRTRKQQEGDDNCEVIAKKTHVSLVVWV